MKKKILTIIPSLFGGGAEKFAADITRSLADVYQHRMLLYNVKEDKFEYSGELVALDIPAKVGFIRRLRRQFFIFKKVKNFKNKFQPEVSISHMLMANILNILTKKQDKVICMLHGEWSVKSGIHPALDQFIKVCYAKCDMVISVSHHIKQMFDNYYNLKVPHEVIYIGINVDQVKKKAEEEATVNLPEKYLVYVAGLRPVKNHVLLLRQLKTFLKRTDMHLVLVGDGPLCHDIEKVILDLGLAEKVHLLGNLRNPYPVIKQALLSLMASSSESFSLVVIESMALGTPVIATDCGGPRELIIHEWKKEILLPHFGEFGVLIEKPEKWDKDSLVVVIDKLIKESLLRESMSEKAAERAYYFDLRETEKRIKALINRQFRS